ncbi:hypothetical protein FAM38_24370, partial [Klebsiella pneumoniae subsp. pneumoniae]
FGFFLTPARVCFYVGCGFKNPPKNPPPPPPTPPPPAPPAPPALAPYKLTALANIPCNHTTSAHTLTASRPHCAGSLHDFSQLHKKLR